MSGIERRHGEQGEQVVERLLVYAGWEILEHHPRTCGHTLDWLAFHPDYDETLFEVKVWRDPKAVGTDNVKKALGVAADLRLAGETRPYILVLSHELTGLHAVMLRRYLDAGIVTEVLVLALVPFPRVMP